MAYKILTDGSVIDIDLSDRGSRVDLELAQEVVEGYIEPVRINDETLMIVNEEGLLKDLPINISASVIASRKIVGNVLVVKCYFDKKEEDEIWV